MKKTRLGIRSGKKVLAVLSGVILAGFLVFLLVFNYRSQIRLKQTALDRLTAQIEIQALGISHLCSERWIDLNNLVKAREIRVFFENKALGMSMQYGLKASLGQIRKLFQCMIDERTMHGISVYSRIAFLDTENQLLADHSSLQRENDHGIPWDMFFKQNIQASAIRAFQFKDHIDVIAAVPYFFKGTYMGHIVAWINPEIFITTPLSVKGDPDDQETMICFRASDPEIFFPVPRNTIAGSILDLPPGRPHQLSDVRNGRKRDLWVVQTAIPATSFSLIAALPESNVTAYSNPSGLLVVLLLMALFVFGSSYLFWRMHVRELVLETRLFQDNIRKKEIEKKNAQLENEIMVSKSLQKSLKESEEKFKTMTMSAKDAVIMINAKGGICFWNRAASNIFGYSAGEALDQNFFLVMTPPRYHRGYLKGFKTFQMTGKGHVIGKTLELEGQRKNGEIFPIELSLSAVKIDNNWHAIGILRDICERKKNEAELAAHKENLELLVKERTRDLEQAQKELINKAVEAGRAQLSAMILHNIGNAITPVSVRTEKLKQCDLLELGRYLKACYRELSDHKGDLNQFVTRDERGVKILAYMTRLIDEIETKHLDLKKNIDSISLGVEYVSQILSLQRAYAPGNSQMKEKVNLNQLVKDALKIQEATISKRQIDVHLSLSPQLPKVLIEKNKLMQVVVNFIKNSCDAIDENKEIRSHMIHVSTFAEDAWSVVKISDTGCGVEGGHIKKIFEFGTSSKGSSGFGLYYCKNFVENNHGRLFMESQGKNRGAVITMKLP